MPTKTYSSKIYKELATVDQIVDGLGMYVDEAIRLPVAALRCLGFATTGSCSGHLDRPGTEGPWIDIESPLALAYWEAVAKQPESPKPADEDIRKQNLLARARLLPLLEEFYTDRRVPINTKLAVAGLARGWSRLQCQGAETARLPEKAAEYPQWLHNAQTEMQAFAEFLCTKVKG